MRTSLRLVEPPHKDPEVRSLKAARRVLVVEADYFALTSRIDPNVIFWDANSAQTNTEIPIGVTHIWISNYTSTERRLELESQASERKIEVWRCAICELRYRLLPVWGISSNRSIMSPVNPDGSVVAEQQASDGPLAALRKAWERVKKERIEPRLVASTSSPIAKAHTVTPSVTAVHRPVVDTSSFAPKLNWVEALAELPDLDRQIFSKVFGINPGEEPQAPEDVAGEFALPVENLKRILKRVEKKLEARGITLT